MILNAAMIRVTGILIAFGVMNTAALAAPNATEKQAGAENQSAALSAPVSVLQVTGTTNSFTISAQHADVLSLLKLVFDQAHRQFVPDASVTGDVTFALSGQKFDTVLASICRQTFLRYEVDKQGIYQFRRDEEGLRNLLLKTQTINNVLSEQLRRMGYAVPSAPLGPDSASRGRVVPGTQATPGEMVNGGLGTASRGGAGGFGGGGFGRNDSGYVGGQRRGEGASNAPVVVPGDTLTTRRSADSSKEAGIGSTDTKARTARKPDNRSGLEGTQQSAGVNGVLGGTGQAGPAGPAAAPGSGGQSAGIYRDGQANVRGFAPSELEFANPGQYQSFMKQNNFVSVNTRGEKAPVLQILADLSRQAGVPILIDPDVPKAEEFVVSATIPARPLNEMLNILGYYARLEWRWVNGRIYVTTTPQLHLYLHGAMLPAPSNGDNIGNGITVLPQRSAAPQNQAPQKRAEAVEKGKEDKKDGKGAGG